MRAALTQGSYHLLPGLPGLLLGSGLSPGRSPARALPAAACSFALALSAETEHGSPHLAHRRHAVIAVIARGGRQTRLLPQLAYCWQVWHSLVTVLLLIGQSRCPILVFAPLALRGLADALAWPH